MKTVILRPGQLTTENVLIALSMYPVGRMILNHLKREHITVDQAKIKIKTACATVSLEWVGTTRDGAWHLSHSSNSRAGGENIRETSVAFMKFMNFVWLLGDMSGMVSGYVRN